MSRGTFICKACGKSYVACRTPNPGVFRWRDIACSPECASEYISRVEAARAKADIASVVDAVETVNVACDAEVVDAAEHDVDAVVDVYVDDAFDDDDFDDEFYDDFEDEDDEADDYDDEI